MTPYTDQPQIPKYRELPPTSGGARSGWHVFGADDETGLINLQTPESVVDAAQLVRSGEVFRLDVDLGTVDPPMFERGVVRHETLQEGAGVGFDDRLDNYYPQASSHWDSLAHVPFQPGEFYNGADVEQITNDGRNGLHHWARRGIVGRAVLLDVAAVLSDEDAAGYDPSSSLRVDVEHLETARRQAGVEWRPGDIALLHTGFLAWYVSQPPAVREEYRSEKSGTAVGLAQGPEMLEYLWDSRISAVAADNPAVEAMPFDISTSAWPFGFLHNCLIGQLGMAVGELWWLHDLALRCRADGRYTALLSSAPLALVGGIGSPANALAIR